MMKVVYVYVAVIFGGAFLALIYLRAQDRGWPSTIVFLGILTGVSVVQVVRTRKKQARDSGDTSESDVA